MKVAVIGDGKMGLAVAAIARERGHRVTAMLGQADNTEGEGIDRTRLGEPDVVVEFTEPSAAVANIIACVRAGLPIVSGTTGWYAHLPSVIAEVQATGGALFWAPNFSIGIAVLSQAAESAAAAVRRFGGFDVHLVETHHSAKKDRPSGTAAALAKSVGSVLGKEVGVTSVRVGHVPGTHEITFDGPYEQVRLLHHVRDRRVFADGAVSAAEWIPGRIGVFTMRDMIRFQENG